MTNRSVVPRKLARVLLVAPLAIGAAALAFAASATHAASTVTPSTTADDGSNTSLRGLLENASPGDTVALVAGATYQLTRCTASGSVSGQALSTGSIEIAAAVTIEGNGATIQQACPDRVLTTHDDITIDDTTITGGNVDGDGGGLDVEDGATTTLTGDTFTGNTASEDGGGVEASGDITVTNCRFTDNHANSGENGGGGGIQWGPSSGTATITGTTFSDNTTGAWGGGFEQEDFSEEGTSASGDLTITISGVTFSGNTAESDGGGGFDVEDASTINIDHSSFLDNTGGQGGGIGTFDDPMTLNVSTTTIANNTSEEGGGAVLESTGDNVTGTYVNSTVTGNTSAFGGAINGEDVSLTYVTLDGNTTQNESEDSQATSGRNAHAAQDQPEAANLTTDGTLTTFATDITNPIGAPNCSLGATPTSHGYNFTDDTSCQLIGTGDTHTGNPLLGALADNGGPTLTQLPQTGSPLIDAVPTASCQSDGASGVSTDQRGVTRPQGSGCDIGAVEVEVVVPAPPAPPPVVIQPAFTG
jgi:predicted outer membrane repeat protein